MKRFRYVCDLREWLAPMGYQQFWQEIRPYCVVIPDRDECDEALASGRLTMGNLLPVLKDMAAMQFARRHGLPIRPGTPHLQVVESH